MIGLPTFKVGDGRAWIELSPSDRPPFDEEAYPAKASFRWGRVSGSWDLDLFDVPGFADELDLLDRTLAGAAQLSDHDGLSIKLQLTPVGHLAAAVWINGRWALDIEPDLEFEILVGDQTFLPALSQVVRDAFPPRPNAPRRAAV